MEAEKLQFIFYYYYCKTMKLKRFLLRYYPPGVILEYELRDKSREMKEIDLLHLTAE